MKSVFPSLTDTIRRPTIVRRSPRATVSTSGSSGMKGSPAKYHIPSLRYMRVSQITGNLQSHAASATQFW